MPDNPYINLLVTAALTVLFIIGSSYGLGALARAIVRARGGTPKHQQNTFAGYFLLHHGLLAF